MTTINEDTLIEKITNAIDELSDIDDWISTYMEIIDEQVSSLDIKDNIMLIELYSGDIYNAIQKYDDHFGDFNIKQKKSMFYAQLAYISIYDKFYDTINDYVNNI